MLPNGECEMPYIVSETLTVLPFATKSFPLIRVFRFCYYIIKEHTCMEWSVRHTPVVLYGVCNPHVTMMSCSQLHRPHTHADSVYARFYIAEWKSIYALHKLVLGASGWCEELAGKQSVGLRKGEGGRARGITNKGVQHTVSPNETAHNGCTLTH